MFQIFGPKELRDGAHACERICVYLALISAVSGQISLFSAAPRVHGDLRCVGCGGVCRRCRQGEHREEASGEILKDELVVKQQHGPLCRLLKAAPAWWQMGREFGFIRPFWKTFHFLDEEAVSFDVKHKLSLGNILEGRIYSLRLICSKYSACIYEQHGTANN